MTVHLFHSSWRTIAAPIVALALLHVPAVSQAEVRSAEYTAETTSVDNVVDALTRGDIETAETELVDVLLASGHGGHACRLSDLVDGDYRFHCSARGAALRVLANPNLTDGAILVTSGTGRGMPQTREHILLGRHANAPSLGSAASRCQPLDGDEQELVEVVQSELNDLMDSVSSAPSADKASSSLMPIDDILAITGRGTVALSAISPGLVRVAETMELTPLVELIKTSCAGTALLRSFVQRGEAGDNVGLLLRGIEKTEIRRGQVIARSGSITPHSEFKAEIYILKKEEGGRHTPFHNKYRPQLYLRTTDVTGEIILESGREMVMPGDNLSVAPEYLVPIDLDQMESLAIREGGRTVGAGQVTEILN